MKEAGTLSRDLGDLRNFGLVNDIDIRSTNDSRVAAGVSLTVTRAFVLQI